MLRTLVAALVLANVVFFAFTHGALDGLFGLRAAGDREPERLSNQVRPETIRLLPSTAAASAPPEVATCWETPVFGAAEAAAIETTLASALPPGSWTDSRGERSVGTRVEATHTYRVAAADGALAARLTLLRLDPGGRGFSPCAKSA
ncbi:MAG TPA: hypothetical protein VGH48_15545, partial [Caldimonas sp.]